MNLTIKQWSEINENQLDILSSLILQSAEQFYHLIPTDEDIILFIIESMRNTESDLNDCMAIMNGEKIIGALSFYSTQELQGRFLYYMRKISDRTFHGNLMKYFKSIPSIKSEGSYLSRIAVIDDSKGSGAAAKVLSLFESISKEKGQKNAFLHVHVENKRAIKFYKNNSYKILTDSFDEAAHQYHLMTKSL